VLHACTCAQLHHVFVQAARCTHVRSSDLRDSLCNSLCWCRYDVIVVGIGGMGSAALYHLAKRGSRVNSRDNEQVMMCAHVQSHSAACRSAPSSCPARGVWHRSLGLRSSASHTRWAAATACHASSGWPTTKTHGAHPEDVNILCIGAAQ
jgi:hypothetical protein